MPVFVRAHVGARQDVFDVMQSLEEIMGIPDVGGVVCTRTCACMCVFEGQRDNFPTLWTINYKTSNLTLQKSRF